MSPGEYRLVIEASNNGKRFDAASVRVVVREAPLDVGEIVLTFPAN